MRQTLLFAALAAASLTTQAQTAAGVGPNAAVRAAVMGVNPAANIRSISESPIAGLRQVIAEGNVVYVSADGRYLIAGDIIDLRNKSNLTDVARSGIRSALLADSPTSEHIVYKAKNEKARVFVFTDISCGYCQILHRSIPELNARGITVEYLAWPRNGTSGQVFNQMRAIWCAADPKKAFDDAVAGRPVASANCRSPVANQFVLGQELQVEGTPAIYTTDGTHIGGALTPDQMAQALSLN